MMDSTVSLFIFSISQTNELILEMGKVIVELKLDWFSYFNSLPVSNLIYSLLLGYLKSYEL